jgi:uncharacterized protein YdhG (YjbR/CyaY superfamily)
MQKKDGETEVREAINAMPEPDREMGEKLHEIIKTSAPQLVPRTWYGMPAYTIKTESKGDKILCFFRSRQKFGERYMTLGFNDVAKLDDGKMWPITFALSELTDAEEAEIAALIKKAVG